MSVLPNGIRVVSENVDHVQSVAVGLWCKTGSRNELDSEAGITHLIEHMLFKGTSRRTAKEIAESIEGRGGHLNAFTDKEATCYYCRSLADDLENAVDVLADMMRNSLIEPTELEREKQVVLEEISRSEDEPSDHVHDLHLEARWAGHPLGKPIIGTRDSVSGFERDNLDIYMRRRYLAGNVLLSVAGKVDHERLVNMAIDRLGEVPSGSDEGTCARPEGTPGSRYFGREVEAVHFCIGTDGVSLYDEELHTAAVLDAALGGSMSSRLFQEIREKRGLAYAIGSYTLNYTAGGAFTVYGGTMKSNWEQVQELVRIELSKVRATGLDEDELRKTKRQICGNLVLGLEGMSARMMRQSKNELFHKRQIPVEETVSKVEAVTNAGIVALADRILDEGSLSTTAIGPA